MKSTGAAVEAKRIAPRMHALSAGGRADSPDAPNAAEWQAGRIIEPTVTNLFWVFTAASFVGLVVETIVSYPIDGVWKNRAGFLWGPFSPIYGAGAVLMTLLLNRSGGRPAIAVFAEAAVAGGAFELAAGWFWNHAFGIVAWSYIDKPFNIGGYTCLEVSLVWGAAGLAWARIALPWIARAIARVPRRVLAPLTAAGIAFMALDAAATLTALDCWFDRLSGQTPDTPLQMFFDEHYGNAFMERHFQTMSLYPEIATLNR